MLEATKDFDPVSLDELDSEKPKEHKNIVSLLSVNKNQYFF